MPAPRVQPNCLLVSDGPLGAGSKSTAKLSAGVRRASGCRVQEYSQIVCWCPKGLWVPGPRVQPNCLLVSERPLGAGSKSTAKLSAGVRKASGCRVQEYSQIVCWCPKGLWVPGPRVQPNCLLVSERPLGAGSKSTAKLSAGVRRASGCRVQEYSQIVCWCPKGL